MGTLGGWSKRFLILTRMVVAVVFLSCEVFGSGVLLANVETENLQELEMQNREIPIGDANALKYRKSDRGVTHENMLEPSPLSKENKLGQSKDRLSDEDKISLKSAALRLSSANHRRRRILNAVAHTPYAKPYLGRYQKERLSSKEKTGADELNKSEEKDSPEKRSIFDEMPKLSNLFLI